jgi:hypothetical protein
VIREQEEVGWKGDMMDVYQTRHGRCGPRVSLGGRGGRVVYGERPGGGGRART